MAGVLVCATGVAGVSASPTDVLVMSIAAASNPARAIANDTLKRCSFEGQEGDPKIV
jgi:hypothetical protein